MRGSTDHPTARRRNGGITCPGLERISWIRVVLAEGHPVACHVHGTRHRRPVVVFVPYATARSLIDAGVPAVIREKGAA